MTLGPIWERRLYGLLGPDEFRMAQLRSSAVSDARKVVENEIERLIREKDWHPVLKYIDFLADDEGDLREARRLHRKYFFHPMIHALHGRPTKHSWPRKLDQIIDALIERCFWADFYDQNRLKIRVPAELVVGLILREGFAGRPRRRKSYAQFRAHSFAIECFKKRKRELQSGPRKLSAREAENIAAKEVSKMTTLSKKTLIEGRPNRHRSRRSGR
jgi:hypothetical protein